MSEDYVRRLEQRVDQLDREIMRQIPVRPAGFVSSAGDGVEIRFQIGSDWEADVLCSSWQAIATVIDLSLGATSPAIGDRVVVCDADHIFLTGPPFTLALRTGWARQMQVQDCSNEFMYDPDLPVWKIFSFSGAELRCS